MEERLYSVEEISQILNLHPKTVQRFIREGVIKGRKIGRSWRVHSSDLRDYAHAELAGSAEAANPDFQANITGYERISVSAVVELHEKDPGESSRITNSMMAMLNQKDPSWGISDFRVAQYPENGTARYIFTGSPLFIGEIMKSFQIIAEQED